MRLSSIKLDWKEYLPRRQNIRKLLVSTHAFLQRKWFVIATDVQKISEEIHYLMWLSYGPILDIRTFCVLFGFLSLIISIISFLIACIYFLITSSFLVKSSFADTFFLITFFFLSTYFLLLNSCRRSSETFKEHVKFGKYFFVQQKSVNIDLISIRQE